MNNFQRNALVAVAFHSETDHEVLARVFHKLDRDGDGHLSFSELSEGLNQILGIKAADLLKIYEDCMSVNTAIGFHGRSTAILSS